MINTSLIGEVKGRLVIFFPRSTSKWELILTNIVNDRYFTVRGSREKLIVIFPVCRVKSEFVYYGCRLVRKGLELCGKVKVWVIVVISSGPKFSEVKLTAGL